MRCDRTRVALGARGIAAAAVLVFVAAVPSPRLEGGEAPAAPAANAVKSVPDLVADVTRSIARVDIWRPYQVKDAKTGKVTGLGSAWSAGTGFVIRCDRVGGSDTTDDVEFDIVTNHHVLTFETERDWTAPVWLFCTIYGTTTTNATVLGTDVPADLAVIRARARAPKGEGPRALSWADPAAMRVGEELVAIGFARDIRGRPSVSRGILSATRRTHPNTGAEQGIFGDLIQSDACCNHGNSGGPLLNMRGEVLGVHTYQYGSIVTKDAKDNVSVDVSFGLFFTRSSRTARPFVEQIVRNGKVARLDLGCPMITIVEPNVRFHGWPSAVRVRTSPAIPPTALAAKAGLRAGDVILAVGSAATRPADPQPSQETKIGSVGELNDALGLRGLDACIWVRFLRPPAAVVTAMGAGQEVVYPGGQSQVAYLR